MRIMIIMKAPNWGYYLGMLGYLKHMHTMIPGHDMEFIGKKKMPINNAKLSFSLAFKEGLQLSSSSHRLENMIPQSTPRKKK